MFFEMDLNGAALDESDKRFVVNRKSLIDFVFVPAVKSEFMDPAFSCSKQFRPGKIIMCLLHKQ